MSLAEGISSSFVAPIKFIGKAYKVSTMPFKMVDKLERYFDNKARRKVKKQEQKLKDCINWHVRNGRIEPLKEMSQNNFRAMGFTINKENENTISKESGATEVKSNIEITNLKNELNTRKENRIVDRTIDARKETIKNSLEKLKASREEYNKILQEVYKLESILDEKDNQKELKENEHKVEKEYDRSKDDDFGKAL